MEKDKAMELLESILKTIVEKPEDVKITRNVDEMGVLLSVKLGDGDAGSVIGKGGKTIQAIRTIMTVIGAREHSRISIKLDVPEKKPEEVKKDNLDDLNL